MKKIFTLSTLILAASALSGCGMLSNRIDSDSGIKQKTAEAIGVMPNQIKISQRRAELDSVHYVAKAKGHTYMCYYTSAVAIESDAVCRDMNGKAKAKNCNALLDAAGMC